MRECAHNDMIFTSYLFPNALCSITVAFMWPTSLEYTYKYRSKTNLNEQHNSCTVSFSLEDFEYGDCDPVPYHPLVPWTVTHRKTQQSTMRWVGTLAGLSMAGVSDLMQARKALIRRFLSSTALPSQSLFRLGQVHSRKASASTSSGVWGDFPL